MARTVETKIYSFEELSEEAQEKAIEKFNDCGVDYDWWDDTYRDAKQCGIKINGFDLDRNSRINISLEKSATEVAKALKSDWGEDTELCKLANSFLRMPPNKRNLSEDNFVEQLGEIYLSMLTQGYEFRQSDEYISEFIIANEYEFTKNGDLW